MEGHTSDEMIDILISELTGTGLEHIQQPEFFEAQVYICLHERSTSDSILYQSQCITHFHTQQLID